jgi:hypothetical protein
VMMISVPHHLLVIVPEGGRLLARRQDKLDALDRRHRCNACLVKTCCLSRNAYGLCFGSHPPIPPETPCSTTDRMRNTCRPNNGPKAKPKPKRSIDGATQTDNDRFGPRSAVFPINRQPASQPTTTVLPVFVRVEGSGRLTGLFNNHLVGLVHLFTVFCWGPGGGKGGGGAVDTSPPPRWEWPAPC